MAHLALELPAALHAQLMSLAKKEGVSLKQYALDALARQTAPKYTVHQVPEESLAKQEAAFAALLERLGHASDADVERVLAEREIVEPEPGLTPETVALPGTLG